jgi:hypothetical protein
VPRRDWSPHEWAPLKDALIRIGASVGPLTLAIHVLNQDLLNGRLKSASRQLSSDGKDTWRLLKPSYWRQCRVRDLGFETGRDRGWQQVDVTPVDNVEAVDGCYFFVRRADLDKHYPIAATPTTTAAHRSDDTRPPERRRGPILKHEWHAIDGEIARRCINPKTRLLEIPKSERKLAADMLEWCQQKYEKEPAESEMRDAVKAICAALRAAYK